jgi:hypothetical protein
MMKWHVVISKGAGNFPCSAPSKNLLYLHQSGEDISHYNAYRSRKRSESRSATSFSEELRHLKSAAKSLSLLSATSRFGGSSNSSERKPSSQRTNVEWTHWLPLKELRNLQAEENAEEVPQEDQRERFDKLDSHRIHRYPMRPCISVCCFQKIKLLVI